MTLRTPRRHISPRTRRKFQAIKNFIRRALGTSSQPDTKTSSSIEISVSDIKSKITDIEQQLSTVSKHCQDLSCVEESFKEESEIISLQSQQNVEAMKNTESSAAKDVETKLLYKSLNSQDRYNNKKYSVSAKQNDNANEISSDTQSVDRGDRQDFKYKRENIKFENERPERPEYAPVRPKRTHRKYKTTGPINSRISFHSLVDKGNKYYTKPRYSSHHEKRHSRKEYTEPLISKEHSNKEAFRDILKNNERERGDRHKSKRTKRVYSDVDKHFIESIIKKQYKPVKLFGRRDSGFSQFSAPVCRDQELVVGGDDIHEGIELCSCCFDKCRRKRHHCAPQSDFDMRSICDTRLYSSKRNRRVKEREINDYNNSALYDVVPVKEKSSPKTRKKFTDDYISYQCCKEVPPSPRSNRPRLNLKVQHCEDYEDTLYNERIQYRKISPTRDVRKKFLNVMDSDESADCYPQKIQPIIYNNQKSRKLVLTEEDVETMSSLQHPKVAKEQVNISNNDTTLNTQLTESATDKPDRTLSEIKDILKTLMLEIKKESSFSEKSDGTSKNNNKLTQENSNTLPNSNNNYRQIPPFMPTFPNPCCYPVLPVCPMSCMQNGYVISSPSYTCNMCAKTSKEHACLGNDSNNKSTPVEEMNETQELIKEIYKCVSQKPKYHQTRKYDGHGTISARSKSEHLLDKNLLAGGYPGGSSKASKLDAKIGTSHLKCYSKSCEAFGSRIPSDTYNTDARCSDTILDKLSLEVTQSCSETDLSAYISEEKVKRGKLSKVLNSFKLFKNKKKNVLEEMNETESTVEDIPKSPYNQHIQSYAMHSQEYYNAPPLGQYCCPSRHKCLPQNYTHTPPNNFSNKNNNNYHDRAPDRQCFPKYPRAPPYPNCDNFYDQIPPQVPVCLREIEVKSIGIQSDRKESILEKIIKKIPAQQASNQGASRHATFDSKKNNFWKSFPDNANQNHHDTINFSYKTQKDLAQRDMNLKNAMIKKLFYKRNPFSPSNLIMRTLLGKNKSLYDNPPQAFKPRMFF
ncbi:uncharacterized protein LOC112052720 isoform X2 [Bicyclus anynana]|uniref:Uncharacterized protein LOC112052720 isoform X2 n=1 Tax=Bicyclus anynana TaxID=110368 RepID=A0A6J1NL58_BICAN|nr:uncharacterized protein LOC112052720 isoform X2 [Bicyclus anynana]